MFIADIEGQEVPDFSETESSSTSEMDKVVAKSGRKAVEPPPKRVKLNDLSATEVDQLLSEADDQVEEDESIPNNQKSDMNKINITSDFMSHCLAFASMLQKGNLRKIFSCNVP